MKKKTIYNLILLELVFFIYSLSSLLSKLASSSSDVYHYIFFYLGSLAMLGVYAVIWQQILKKFSLTVAFANKGIVIIWGMIWGLIVFKEKITVGMIIGSLIIIAGIITMMLGARKND